MSSRRLNAVLAALLLCAAALLAFGCARAADRGVDSGSASAAPTTAMTSPTGSASAARASSASGELSTAAAPAAASAAGAAQVSSAASTKGLGASDAKALDAELAAIQRQLDKTNLPSDSDFGSLESGLK